MRHKGRFMNKSHLESSLIFMSLTVESIRRRTMNANTVQRSPFIKNLSAQPAEIIKKSTNEEKWTHVTTFIKCIKAKISEKNIENHGTQNPN